MAATISQYSVTTSAIKIASANAARQELFISNSSVTPDVFIGPDSSVTAATGFPLFAGQTQTRSRGFNMYLGDIYAISASGTADIRVWETTQ